jgi:hypothetical protein
VCKQLAIAASDSPCDLAIVHEHAAVHALTIDDAKNRRAFRG